MDLLGEGVNDNIEIAQNTENWTTQVATDQEEAVRKMKIS